ncbi:MAG: hypothetical protein M3Y91_08500 [Actinomycetota bacterium]|nr:hypothetical protein [Actinomycetota bacterium]
MQPRPTRFAIPAFVLAVGGLVLTPGFPFTFPFIFLCSLLALIFGAFGAQRGRDLRGLAVTALVIGGILFLGTIATITWIATLS